MSATRRPCSGVRQDKRHIAGPLQDAAEKNPNFAEDPQIRL